MKNKKLLTIYSFYLLVFLVAPIKKAYGKNIYYLTGMGNQLFTHVGTGFNQDDWKKHISVLEKTFFLFPAFHTPIKSLPA